MKFNARLVSATLALGASAAMFSGCSGSQTPFTPLTPIASGRQPIAPESIAKVNGPDVISAPGDLVYVASSTGCGFVRSGICHAMVSVYSYPDGGYRGKWIDESNGNDVRSHTGGECADNAGHVFVTYTGASGKILEFAHGATKPMATLSDSKGDPFSCSFDPTTGDLAVVTTDHLGGNELLVYKNASSGRNGIAYSDPNLTLTNVAYDDNGNAFVDGPSGLAELARDAKSFQKVTLNRTIQSFGSLQWDGQYLAVTDIGTDDVYRFAIKANGNGSIGGFVAGYTELGDRSNGKGYNTTRITETWVAGNTIVASRMRAGICDFKCPGSVDVWHYPAGGPAFRNIGGGAIFDNPSGVAVSAR